MILDFFGKAGTDPQPDKINENDFIFKDNKGQLFRCRREVLILELLCWNPQKQHWVFVRYWPDEVALKYHANALPTHEAEQYLGGVPLLK